MNFVLVVCFRFLSCHIIDQRILSNVKNVKLFLGAKYGF